MDDKEKEIQEYALDSIEFEKRLMEFMMNDKEQKVHVVISSLGIILTKMAFEFGILDRVIESFINSKKSLEKYNK